MENMIDSVEYTTTSLRIQLKNSQSLDVQLLSLIEADDLCLPCFL